MILSVTVADSGPCQVSMKTSNLYSLQQENGTTRYLYAPIARLHPACETTPYKK